MATSMSSYDIIGLRHHMIENTTRWLMTNGCMKYGNHVMRADSFRNYAIWLLCHDMDVGILDIVC